MELMTNLIQNNPIFRQISPKNLDLLEKTAISRQYVKGELIVLDGDIWPYLFLIVKGSVHAIKSSAEGRNLVVTTFDPGDIFWGLAFFFDHQQMTVTLEAAEDLFLLLWSDEVLVPILKQDGAAAWELSRTMISKMLRASEILEEMTFQPVAGRLAKLLMDTVKDQHHKPVSRSLTLDEMAARIGSTREMVCRFLHRFAHDEIIDITRTEFRVTDAKKLREIAKNFKG